MKTSPRPFLSPLVLVVAWTLTGLVLNSVPSSLTVKCWVILIGVIVPFGARWMDPSPTKPFYPFEMDEWFPSLASWVPAFLLILAVFFRFWGLNTYLPWPLGDESLYLSYALELSRHWTWRFFFGNAQHPPLFIWMLNGVYSITRSPFLTLRLTTALISLANVGVTYAAARKFLSRSSSYALCAFCALGFWPVYFGRFSLAGTLLPLLTGFLFYAWGSWCQSPTQTQGRLWAIAWGLVLAAGLYSFPSWFFMVMAVGLVWLVKAWRNEPMRRDWPWFLAGFLALALPFFYAMISENFGGHISRLAPFQSDSGFLGQWINSFSYLTVLLWGSLDRSFAYGPFWGGFLNPLQGALFLLGCVECVNRRKAAT